MSDYSDYYENTSPFDEEVESFKDHLRTAVKQEIQDELEKLRTENREQAAKLKNLSQLESAARGTITTYERKIHNAEVTARQTVQKEGLRKLLELIREPRYRVERKWDMEPKCGKCDDQRRLAYTTPRGNEAHEMCECAVRHGNWTVEELLVHEVARRNREVLAWYHPVNRYFDNDDSISSPTVLKSADGVALEELMKNPRDYGFTTEAAAADLATALNGADA